MFVRYSTIIFQVYYINGSSNILRLNLSTVMCIVATIMTKLVRHITYLSFFTVYHTQSLCSKFLEVLEWKTTSISLNDAAPQNSDNIQRQLRVKLLGLQTNPCCKWTNEGNTSNCLPYNVWRIITRFIIRQCSLEMKWCKIFVSTFKRLTWLPKKALYHMRSHQKHSTASGACFAYYDYQLQVLLGKVWFTCFVTKLCPRK